MSKICRFFPVTAVNHLSLGCKSLFSFISLPNALVTEPLMPSATAPAASLPRNFLRSGSDVSLICLSPLGWVGHGSQSRVVYHRVGNRESSSGNQGAGGC